MNPLITEHPARALIISAFNSDPAAFLAKTAELIETLPQTGVSCDTITGLVEQLGHLRSTADIAHEPLYTRAIKAELDRVFAPDRAVSASPYGEYDHDRYSTPEYFVHYVTVTLESADGERYNVDANDTDTIDLESCPDTVLSRLAGCAITDANRPQLLKDLAARADILSLAKTLIEYGYVLHHSGIEGVVEFQ